MVKEKTEGTIRQFCAFFALTVIVRRRNRSDRRYQNMKTIIMNFSGVYPEEDFYRQDSYEMMDFTRAEGVNCYCTCESEQDIKEKIREYGPFGIHFLDSGNYHYLSKLWMEMIDVPFSLLLFDNHTDMQESAFFGLLSCGSWVREALSSNPMLKSVCVVGPKEADLRKDMPTEKVTWISGEELRVGKMEKFKGFLKKDYCPLYLSVDKDILCREDAVTNWDQGEVRLDSLISWIEEAAETRKCIGVDICGENPPEGGFCENRELHINSQTNKRLKQVMAKVLVNFTNNSNSYQND